MTYAGQLDSLRAIAVAMVAWHHWYPQWSFGLPLDSGVQLFFVLSGFLITGILLDAHRSNSVLAGTKVGVNILTSFYARRFLRIFPLYYLALALALLLDLKYIDVDFWWHVFYLSNYRFLLEDRWGGAASHFWSLAVEEQFYIFWPLLLLLVPAGRLRLFFSAIIVFGIVFRGVGVWFFPSVSHWNIATPANMVALGFGALLAHFVRDRVLNDRVDGRFLLRALGFGLVVYVLLVHAPRSSALISVAEHVFLCVIFGVVIICAFRGVGGVGGLLLSYAPLRYLGRISYGLYVFHNFAPVIWQKTGGAIWIAEAGLGRFAGLCAITLGLSVVSWHLMEKPLNDLKRFFPYPSSPARDPGATAPAR